MSPAAKLLRPAALFLASCGLLSACASPDGAYPSLAVRDAERVSGTLQPAVFVPEPPTAATLASLSELQSDAARAHQAFLAAVPAAQRMASSASGAAVGSENWARAQVAVANLESIRSRAMIALADLDRLFVVAATEGGALDDIGLARSNVIDMVFQQDRQIAALLANLR